MKIGILTFHASHNYGSMLQAYALQHILSLWGHENRIINLRTPIQRFLIQPQLEWKHPRASLFKLLKSPCASVSLQRKYNRFEHFLFNDLRITAEYSHHDEVEKAIRMNGYDAVIVGSDQIWNTGCSDFDNSYLLDFDLPIRRIAYAPSLGPSPEEIGADKKIMLCNAWQKIDNLSVREQRGADFIYNLTGRMPQVVLDPSLLLNKEDYAKISSERRVVSGPYIFYYSPIDHPKIFEKVISFSREVNMKIVITQEQPYYQGDNLIRITDCGPREFLNIIKYADYTFGKSFHLLAFSLIYHKEFYMVTGDTDSRLMNLLQSLNLKNRAIPLNANYISLAPRINYAIIQAEIEKMRATSLNYLHNALK